MSMPAAAPHRPPKMSSAAIVQLNTTLADTHQRFEQLSQAGELQQAYQLARQVATRYPFVAPIWISAGVAALNLGEFQHARQCFQAALQCAPDSIEPLDGLADCLWQLGERVLSQRYGLRSLQLKDAMPACIQPQPLTNAPAAFNSADPSRNIIAFSLFGNQPRYCETAKLNVRAAHTFYPHWRCRFYVDDTVMPDVAEQLQQLGAQVVFAPADMRHWAGTLWRFLAVDDPLVDRVIVRDADSLISRREMHAVEQWLNSDQYFHVMRDWGSHSELMLAGMWGMARGGLGAYSMRMLLQHFTAQEYSRSHGDQHFLRQWIWPQAKQSLMSHDGIYQFQHALPFPDGAWRKPTAHVGANFGAPQIAKTSSAPEGSDVMVNIHHGDSILCRYPAKVLHGEWRLHLPDCYAHKIQRGEYWVSDALI